MRKIVVFAGLLAAPAGHTIAQQTTEQDPRLIRLKQFFESYDCPLSQFAGDFVQAADRNQLDWRLLPSISMMESGGGKNYRNKNVFGWDSGRERFSSISAGIHAVASRLSRSKLYKHKGLDQILYTYNPRPDYARKVKTWMRTIGPTTQIYAPALN